MAEALYYAHHGVSVEAALSRAVDAAFTEQVADPLTFIARLLLKEAGVAGDGVAFSDPDATSQGEWTARAWVSSIGVASPIVDALLDGSTADCFQSMRAIAKRMDSAEAVAEHLLKGQAVAKLSAVLYPALAELSSANAAPDGDLQSKFASAIEMSYSGLDTFYGGLEGRIGEPQAAVMETMRAEHQKRTESTVAFTTGNYGVTTTSSAEWLFVLEPTDGGLRRAGREAWASEAEEKLSDRSLCRKPEALEALLERCATKNELLAQQGEPEVIKEEVVAARLYTGPMFVKYNGVLRGLKSKSDFLRNSMVQLCSAPEVVRGFMGNAKTHEKAAGTLPWESARAQCNKYVTTLHAINSCIVKTGKLTRCSKVYRGMSGMALPDQFWRENAHGVRGGVENAFMSTTLSRDVAMGYAGGTGRAGLVFEVQMGMIDRGADISWLSQYPHEREILFGPLTGIEVQGTRVEGAVVVIEARLSVNLNALTIEQVISKMLRSHTSLLDSLLAKLRFCGSPDGCLQPLLDLRHASKARGREFFNEPSLFVGATQEALDAKRACVEQLGQLDSWDGVAEVPEVLGAQLRRAAELLAVEGRHGEAGDLLIRAVEVAPPPASAVAAVDALCAQQLVSPTVHERLALLALDHFLRFSGEDPHAAPWPEVVRKLTKKSGDSPGTGIAYAVTAAAHHAPMGLVKPQLFAAECTPKALKGSALLYAASVGDAAGVRAALEYIGGGVEGQRLAANRSMDQGVTPLMLACHAGSLEATRLLLEADAEPNLTSQSGCNALACAAVLEPHGGMHARAVLVELLIAKKANVNISHPDKDRQKAVVSKNVGINYPVLAAVTRGSDACRNLLALLRAGADANARDGFGMTALHHAARGGNGMNFKCLLGDPSLPFGKSLNDELAEMRAGRSSLEVDVVDEDGGWTPLMYAIVKGEERFVRALLAVGAEADALRPGQITRPLLLAADHGDLQIVNLLLQAKADVNHCGIDRETALATVSAYAEGARLELLLNAPGAQGQSALITAATAGHLEVAKALLAAGADVTAVSHHGWSAYVAAVVSGQTELAKVLLSAGAAPWDMMRDGFPRETRSLSFRRALRSGAVLTELPASLGECKHLEKIRMDGCDQLVCLPASICSCSALSVLSLKDCSALTTLPYAMGDLQLLETLDLTRCSNLTSLPTSLRQCAKLKRLVVKGCVALMSNITEAEISLELGGGARLEVD